VGAEGAGVEVEMNARPAAAVMVLILAGVMASAIPSRADVARTAPGGAPSSADVAPPDEPGERLEVHGVVYAADGRTPVPRASVYVYQTDARGYYRPDDAMANRNPRLMALLRTDGQGRYSYRTVRPGSYPGTRVPRHIHYEVTADGRGARVFEIVFEDDPFVTPQVRDAASRAGSFYSLRAVQRAPGGAGRVEQDVVLPDR
jgi:protocatechuate 3,4-dioxygenase, beta subunit